MDDQETLQSALGSGAFNPMDALPMDAFTVPDLHVGDTKSGAIVSISQNEILVSIGYKSDAVVDPRELDRLDKSYLDDLKVGDPVTRLRHPDRRPGRERRRVALARPAGTGLARS